MLPEEFIQSCSDAPHSIGRITVLDYIASGSVWVDIKALVNLSTSKMDGVTVCSICRIVGMHFYSHAANSRNLL